MTREVVPPARWRAGDLSWLVNASRTLIEGLSPPDVAAPHLFGIAEAASISSMLAHHHVRNGVSIPAESERLVAESQIVLLRNKQALFQLSRVLDEAGVRWLVFKGPVLARRFYVNESGRRYGDLDLLVHPDDLLTALAALTIAGAEHIDQNWALIRSKRQSEISLRWRSTLVDLHWHFYSNPVVRKQFDLEIRAVLSTSRPLDMGGFTVPAPDDLDNLIFIATHAVLSGGHRLRWMIDFALAFRSIAPDADELFARARERRAELPLAVMFQRAEGALGIALMRPRPRLSFGHEVWLLVCRSAALIAPIESELIGRASGRAVFGATRRGARSSWAALLHNLIAALRSRRNGRFEDIDRSVLHSPGGTEDDRLAWIHGARFDGYTEPACDRADQ